MEVTQDQGNIPVPPPLPEIRITGAAVTPAPRPTFEPLRIHFAVNNGDVVEARRQLARGVSLEYVTQGLTPLILAIHKEQTEIALLLAKGGADVNHAEETKQARLPIHVAAKYGNLDIVRTLIEKGASVHSTDNDLMTPLHVVCYEGHLEVVKYLIDIGAHINCLDGRGRSPLFNAIGYNHIDVVEYLISVGGIINCTDSIGWTPLIESVVCGYVELVKLLLENGADVNFPDRVGNTPLYHACARLNKTQQMCLIASNFDYTMRHLLTLTPVARRAIRHINSYIYEIVYLLLDFGAEVNVKNIDNETPLEIAVFSNKHQVIALLLSAGAQMDFSEPWQPPVIDTMLHLKDLIQWMMDTGQNQPPQLASLAKYAIRKFLRKNISAKITKLPLPESLKCFLQVDLDK